MHARPCKYTIPSVKNDTLHYREHGRVTWARALLDHCKVSPSGTESCMSVHSAAPPRSPTPMLLRLSPQTIFSVSTKRGTFFQDVTR